MNLLIILTSWLMSLFLTIRTNDEPSLSSCSCLAGELHEIERLNKELKRIRIEYENGTNKYSDNQLSYNSNLQCGSNVLYEINENGQSIKKCRVCDLNGGWSELIACDKIRCDREAIASADVTFKLKNSQQPVEPDHKLFEPGKVIAIFNYSGKKVCKKCETNGEWTKYSETSLCKDSLMSKPRANCSYEALQIAEYQQLDSIRIRIESPDGLNKLNVKNLIDNKLPLKTVVVYQKYLSGLSSSALNKYQDKSYYPSNPYTRKFCRYCEDGVWSELESCVSLKCDKDVLLGDPDFELIPNNSNKQLNQQTLFEPYSVKAIYSFGRDRFCKQCHENGEWSRFSVSELCDIQLNPANNQFSPSSSLSEYILINKIKDVNKYNFEEIYKKESSCNLKSLNTVEDNLTNFSRLYFISPDGKRKLNPEDDAKIPSRTISIYEHNNETIDEHYCSICINSVWSNITSICVTSSSLFYCERSKLNGTYSIRVNDMNTKASDSQNMFEPGSAMVIYELTETTRLCKICERKNRSAEWSHFAQAYLCNPRIAFSKTDFHLLKYAESCMLSELEKNEKSEYIRESIQSWDAKRYLNHTLFKDKSMAVYRMISTNTLKSNIKWCRKCNNGKWDNYYLPCPIEFSIKKCDPTKIRNVDYFVNTNDNSRLNDDEKANLVIPGKVVAVYEFGIQRYCKECYEDGTWTSYPQVQACKSLIFK